MAQAGRARRATVRCARAHRLCPEVAAGVDEAGLGVSWWISVPVMSGLGSPVSEVTAETAGVATPMLRGRSCPFG
jgi:hypothetical protein